MARNAVAGTKFCECDECGHRFNFKCRDIYSLSGTDCPNCGEEADVVNVEKDAE